MKAFAFGLGVGVVVGAVVTSSSTVVLVGTSTVVCTIFDAIDRALTHPATDRNLLL